MKKSFDERIKNYLLTIMQQEGDGAAWEHFKTLEPTCDDLSAVILFTPFVKEAWIAFEQLHPNQEDLLYLVEHSDDQWIRKKAEGLLLHNFSLDMETLESLVLHNYSDEAAKLLLNQQPSNDQLISILSHSNLSDKAAQVLLSSDQEIEELQEIIKYSTLKTEAWHKLVEQSPTPEEVIDIIQETDFEEVAWNYLIQQHPSNKDLGILIKDYAHSGKKRKEAAEYVLNNKPNLLDLIELIKQELCVKEAWKLLCNLSPSSSELSAVVWSLVKWDYSIKNEVAKWCLSFQPCKRDLWYILEYSDEKEEAALQLLKLPLEWHELADLVVQCAIEPVLEVISKRVGFDRSTVQEELLIQEIASKLLDNPAFLDVNHWHNEDSHCVGGWAIQYNDKAQEIEQQYGSEIAACLLLPNYRHLFFAAHEEVLRQLQTILLKE